MNIRRHKGRSKHFGSRYIRGNMPAVSLFSQQLELELYLRTHQGFQVS